VSAATYSATGEPVPMDPGVILMRALEVSNTAQACVGVLKDMSDELNDCNPPDEGFGNEGVQECKQAEKAGCDPQPHPNLATMCTAVASAVCCRYGSHMCFVDAMHRTGTAPFWRDFLKVVKGGLSALPLRWFGQFAWTPPLWGSGYWPRPRSKGGR
jgi:hypothetical protein